MKLCCTLFFLAVLCSNCQKTTQATGVVYNYFTGKPIPGVTVGLIGYDGTQPDSPVPTRCTLDETTTDENGAYNLEVGCFGMDNVSIRVGGEHQQFFGFYFFAKRSADLRLGKFNEIDFQLDSIDGGLKVQLFNQQGIDDTLYVRVYCNAIGLPTYYGGQVTPIAVPGGTSSSKFWYVTANRYVKYYWDTVPFSDFNAAHVDSVFCTRGDTTVCSIVF
jgi:hypothetical protein